MAKHQDGSGKKTRKYSRNAVKCSRYANEHRRTRNVHGRTGIDGPLRKQRKDERTPH